MLHKAPVSNRNMPFLNIHSTALTLLPTEQFESNIFYVLISRNNFNSNCLLFKDSRHNIHGILSQSPFVQIESNSHGVIQPRFSQEQCTISVLLVSTTTYEYNSSKKECKLSPYAKGLSERYIIAEYTTRYPIKNPLLLCIPVFR
jgi:hypothetical protein